MGLLPKITGTQNVTRGGKDDGTKKKKIIAMYDIFTLTKQGKYIIHFKRILGKWVKC